MRPAEILGSLIATLATLWRWKIRSTTIGREAALTIRNELRLAATTAILATIFCGVPGRREPLIDLINSARRSLYVYNEEMADMDVTKALIDAAERGVVVYVDMTGAAEWKWEFEELTTAGAHVRVYADDPAAPLYIHAKMIVADDGNPPRARL